MVITNIIIILGVMLHPIHSVSVSVDEDIFTINVTMKDYQSIKEDQIVFVQYQLPDEELTIIGYTPLLSTPTAHHMNTFACENLYSQERFWNDGVACAAGAQMLLYGWDRNAMPVRFPEEAGIAVGKNTPYKFIVVNIHYLPRVKNDYSGNQLIMSRKRRKYLAGVMTGGASSFQLPPHTHTIKTPFSCRYNGPSISIFAAGVHAHEWARVNSMYRVRNGKITPIFKGDPQQTHRSYSLPSFIEILDGDFLIGQCVYDNDENRVISMGLTHTDEMCNVMAGYLYERNSDQLHHSMVPLENCWGDEFPHLSALIPSDSEVPPEKPSGLNRTDQGDRQITAEHGMTTSIDLSMQTTGKTNDIRQKVLYLSAVTVMVSGIAFLLAVIIGRLFRGKILDVFDCANKLPEKEILTRPNRHSIFTGWLNQGDGFKRLEASSDDEHEVVNNEA